MNVEPSLVLRIQVAKDFGMVSTHFVVALSQITQTPIAQLVSIVHLSTTKYKDDINMEKAIQLLLDWVVRDSRHPQ